MAFMHASQDCVEPRRLAERPIKSTGVGRLGLFVDALVYCSGWGLKGKHQMESQPFLEVSRCFDACPHGGTLSACPTNEAASNFPRCGHMALMFSRESPHRLTDMNFPNSVHLHFLLEIRTFNRVKSKKSKNGQTGLFPRVRARLFQPPLCGVGLCACGFGPPGAEGRVYRHLGTHGIFLDLSLFGSSGCWQNDCRSLRRKPRKPPARRPGARRPPPRRPGAVLEFSSPAPGKKEKKGAWTRKVARRVVRSCFPHAWLASDGSGVQVGQVALFSRRSIESARFGLEGMVARTVPQVRLSTQVFW